MSAPTPEQAAHRFIEVMKAVEVPRMHTATVMAAASAWAKAAAIKAERDARRLSSDDEAEV